MWTKEKKKEWQKEYDKTHRIENRAKVKRYRDKNRLALLSKNKKWREEKKKNPDWLKNRAIKTRKRNALNRQKVLELIGGAVCKKCGFDDWRALQIDHKNGGGRHDRVPTYLILKRVKADPKKYQVLCANCNWIKRYKNKEIKKIY